MKIKLCSFFVIIFCVFNMSFVFAEKENAVTNKSIFIDEANVLSDDQKNNLIKKLTEISEKNKCEVSIAVVNTVGEKSPQEYADDLFDYNNYGYGESDDGILLLIDMNKRDWAISTYGFAKTAFKKVGIDYIIYEVKPYLSDNKFYEAFNKFADLCDDFVIKAKSGKPYDSKSLPDTTSGYKRIVISLGMGFFISCGICFFITRKHKSIRAKADANNYICDNSLKMFDSRDVFLFSNVTRKSKNKNNSESHTSSSGRSHGGSSGSF